MAVRGAHERLHGRGGTLTTRVRSEADLARRAGMCERRTSRVARSSHGTSAAWTRTADRTESTRGLGGCDLAAGNGALSREGGKAKVTCPVTTRVVAPSPLPRAWCTSPSINFIISHIKNVSYH
jgi:hypothetical protein